MLERHPLGKKVHNVSTLTVNGTSTPEHPIYEKLLRLAAALVYKGEKFETVLGSEVIVGDWLIGFDSRAGRVRFCRVPAQGKFADRALSAEHVTTIHVLLRFNERNEPHCVVTSFFNDVDVLTTLYGQLNQYATALEIQPLTLSPSLFWKQAEEIAQLTGSLFNIAAHPDTLMFTHDAVIDGTPYRLMYSRSTAIITLDANPQEKHSEFIMNVSAEVHLSHNKVLVGVTYWGKRGTLDHMLSVVRAMVAQH
jgi:hypothetical protein